MLRLPFDGKVTLEYLERPVLFVLPSLLNSCWLYLKRSRVRAGVMYGWLVERTHYP
ncbi:hypothetical protein [Chitinivorax sp. B]|uniref:hypothetical protein n=1 Tax=Chitinivorax sp. B TaxID=2502235 RepID=UPI0014856932|nr:hypothetical protein [Chitinivorax sp. B]